MQFITNNKMLSQTIGFIILMLLTMPSMANNLLSQQLYKGVVIDSYTNMAYVINPKGGIDGISIQTGISLWHTDDADYPLLVNNSQLIAHAGNSAAGTISLVALESTTGNVLQTKAIEIPNHIKANVSHGLNKKFDISVDPNDPFSGKIQWTYKVKTIQGMMPDPDKKPNETVNYGEISLNISDTLSVASSKSSSQKRSPQKISIEGVFINKVNGRQFKSTSSEHVLVSKLKPDASVWNKYTWEIYNLSGELLGKLDNNVSYNSFIVSGDIMMYISYPYDRYKKSGTISAPLTLNAYSLTSNNHLWNMEIRDLKFQGLMPH